MKKIQKNAVRFDNLKQDFLDDKKYSGTAEATLNGYRYDITRFLKFLSDEQLAVNEAGFKRYVIHLTDSGMTANSVNHYIRSVKVFLYWCMEQDEIAPFKIKMVKAQETIKDVYTQEELCALIQPPKREDSFVVWRSWAIINFILGTAAREATVCEMQMQDISFDDRTITFRHLKNKHVQLLPMSEALASCLKKYTCLLHPKSRRCCKNRLYFRFILQNVNEDIDLIFTSRYNKGGDNHRMKGQACSMAHIAYVRVSTAEQNEARQIEALKKHGIDKWFTEKVSGKNMNRPQLEAMLDYMREGDTIYIHDFSRLARSTKDLLAIVEQLQAKNVHLISNKENLDTSTPTGKLMLTMIAAINEFERENLLERQREGIAIAKAEGKFKGGQVKRIDDKTFCAAYDRYQHRELNKTQLAAELRISRPTLNKLLKDKGLS